MQVGLGLEQLSTRYGMKCRNFKPSLDQLDALLENVLSYILLLEKNGSLYTPGNVTAAKTSSM